MNPLILQTIVWAVLWSGILLPLFAFTFFARLRGALMNQ